MTADVAPETLEALLTRMRAVCADIRQDMEDDVHRFDGAPFNGRTVATIHGNLAAAVSALAGMIDKLAESALS